MTDDHVATQFLHNVLTITLNRPNKLNAIDFGMIDALQAMLDIAETDDKVRVVILTGAGDKAFSAGADIAEFDEAVKAGVETALREFVRRGQRLTSRIEAFAKPVVVAVNGLAYGAGCEITEAAPLAVASEHATFAKPEIKLGFPPPFGGTQRLPRLIGRKRALAMILTADPIDARRAEDIGLINMTVPKNELLSAARALAAKISEQSSLAVAAALASVTRGLNATIDEALAIEASQFGRMATTEDIREGIAAFVGKRPAVFVGR
jgi:enoyl-CoA hydratase